MFISLLAALNPFLFFVGVKYTTAMTGQMLYVALPLITIIFSYLINKETITRKKIIGVMIGLIGALFIVIQPALEKGQQFNGNILGNIIILCAVISFALYTILIKKYQKDRSPLELNMYFMLTSLIIQLILLPIDLLTGPTWWNTISAPGILGLLYVGIIGTGIYYLLLQYALKTSSPLATSTTLYLQPLFAIIWASMLLGEHLTSSLLAGSILAFIGIGLVMSSQKTR